MAPSPLDDRDRSRLLAIADEVIVDELLGRDPIVLDAVPLPAELRAPVGLFVSLHVRGALNGCIGSIQTNEPLGVSVARHAWSAAFADPRFPSVTWADYEDLDIEISILSPLASAAASARPVLLDALRPGVDGLLIAAGSKQAVFLPVVWEQLATADEFVSQLFRKAGLSPAAWPSDLRAFVFTTDTFSNREACALADSGPERSSALGLDSELI